MIGPLEVAALVLGAWFVLAWVVHLRLGDAGVVDVFWGPAYVVLIWTWALGWGASGVRTWVMLAAVSLWGLRLALHLLVRFRGLTAEDHRYAEMRAKWGDAFPWVSLGTVFLLQAAIAGLLSVPLYFAVSGTADLGWWDMAGMMLFAVGWTVEAVADAQLEAFRQRRASEREVLDRGLWRYSRHPNYFGEMLVWWGFAAFALGAGGPWWVLASPVLITYLLLKVSGVGLLERHLGERKPEYAAYRRRTSAFIPWPPRSQPPETADGKGK